MSDLGGGKTTFVQGVARGLGYEGVVSSPTFTLNQVYLLPSGKELHHYDLYRLAEGGVVGSELLEDAGDPEVITIIEWPGIIEANLPADRLKITIEVTSEDSREFEFSAYGDRSQAIIKELRHDS